MKALCLLYEPVQIRLLVGSYNFPTSIAFFGIILLDFVWEKIP